MRSLTATEASRSFAALLDEAEQGNTIIVTRGGRRVASIGPAPVGNGQALLSLLTSSTVDEGFASDVRAARDAGVAEVPAWPAD